MDLLDQQGLSYHEVIPAFDCRSKGLDGKPAIESNGLYFYLSEKFIYSIYPSGAITTYDEKFCKRIISTLSALVAIVGMFWLGTLLRNRAFGLLCAFALSTNMFHIGNAVHGRFYAFNEMWIILATIACIHACKHNNYKNWLVYTSLMVLSIGSMILSSLAVVLHAIIILHSSPNKGKSFIWQSVSCILLVIFFWYLNNRDVGAYQRLTAISSWQEIYWQASHFFPLALQHGFLMAHTTQNFIDIGHISETLLYCGYSIITVLAYLGIKDIIQRKKLDVEISLGIGIIGIWISYILFSIYVKNILYQSYQSWLLPFYSIVIAFVAYKLQWFRYVLMLVLFYASFYNTYSTIVYRDIDPEVNLISKYYKSGDIVLISERAYNTPNSLVTLPIQPHIRHELIDYLNGKENDLLYYHPFVKYNDFETLTAKVSNLKIKGVHRIWILHNSPVDNLSSYLALNSKDRYVYNISIYIQSPNLFLVVFTDPD